MKVLIDNKKINLIYANKFKIRLFGLMGKKNIEEGIIFPHCNSIHTFFMREEIDVLLLDKDLSIKYLYPALKKNKIIFKRGIKYIIELPQNTINQYQIKQNSKIKIIE